MSIHNSENDHIKAAVAILPPVSSRKQAAAFLGISPLALSRYVDAGAISAMQAIKGSRTKQGGRGSSLLFTRGEIERCMREWSR